MGTPFLRWHGARIDLDDDTVSLWSSSPESKQYAEPFRIQGRSTCTDSEAGSAEVALVEAGEAALKTLEDQSHPYVFTTEEVVVPARAGVGVEVELPSTLAGEEVVLVPLPDLDRKAYANKRELRLHGPILVKPVLDAASSCKSKCVVYSSVQLWVA